MTPSHLNRRMKHRLAVAANQVAGTAGSEHTNSARGEISKAGQNQVFLLCILEPPHARSGLPDESCKSRSRSVSGAIKQLLYPQLHASSFGKTALCFVQGKAESALLLPVATTLQAYKNASS